MVTVTIKKIDSTWWYNACDKCMRTTKTYGDLYKCAAGHIGKPVQRYKLTMIAGDETGDTNFIMFGRWVQHLTKKTIVTLIDENPQDFIPNEITRLLEKVFKLNVCFTENTTTSSVLCFQVNAVVGEINNTNAPIAPTGSQSSSLMMSQSASSSMQRTPQKSASFPVPSQPTSSLGTHSSSATPTKTSLRICEPQATPQSGRYAEDQNAPSKEIKEEVILLPTQQHTEPTNALAIVTQSAPVMSPETPHDKDDSILAKSEVDVAAGSTTKTRKSLTGKRSRSSPNKKIARKLLLHEDPENEDDDCADDTAKPRYLTTLKFLHKVGL